MTTMEANELYNISLSPLVTSPFALEWSPDNHVSVITERGVHVFELVPNPTCLYATLKFARTFIYPSEYMPAEAYASYVNRALWKMKREEIYELLLQEALTPILEEKNVPTSRVTRATWSPAGMAAPFACLVAITTAAGSLEVLYKSDDSWLSVWNLTELRVRRVEKETKVTAAKVTETSFGDGSWVDHVKRLLGTAVNWSPLLRDGDEKSFAYVVAAFGSSELIVFRLESIADLAELRKPVIVCEHRLETASKVDQLLWIPLEDGERHAIVISYFDGRIDALRMTERQGKLGEAKLLRYQEVADRAKLGCLKRIPGKDGSHVILFTKRSYLVVLNLDRNGECVRTRHLKVDGFSITGLTLVSEDRMILTTQNCRMYIAQIANETEDLKHVRVSHDLKASRVQYLGTAGSANSAILLNVTSPDPIYDHLTNREPSTLQIYALRDERWNPWRITCERVLANRPLHEYWDCLESMRVVAAKCPDGPSQALPELPTDLESRSINELRVIGWLTLISKVLETCEPLRMNDAAWDELTEARPLIFLLSACDYLSRIAKKSHLNDEHKRSASFLRMYMEIYLAGEDEDSADNAITRKVIETFRESSHIATIETETCNLCGEVLSELPWTIDTCPLGHKLPRCSLSLLQITTLQYRSCPVCGRLFHPLLDQDYEAIRCLYCDVPAAYDNRTRIDDREDYEKKWKNLSQRPIGYGQSDNSKNSHDLDNANVTEKTKRRSLNNPQTFAVIVNKDQNYDSPITETWQKF